MATLSAKYPKGIYWYLLYVPNFMLYLTCLGLLLLVVAYPLWQNWQVYQGVRELTPKVEQLRLQQQQQQQILQILQKRVSDRRNSQQNTQKLDQLHQQLTAVSQTQNFSFEMQISNKDLLRIDLRLHITFQQFIESFDQLFQIILAHWAIAAFQIERDPEPSAYGMLFVSIQLFSEDMRQ